MRVLIFLFWVTLSVSAGADVFKCTGKYGQTTYQSSPCAPSKKEQQLDIKFDPVKEAEAKAKLEAIRREYEAQEAAKIQKEQALAAQRNEAASLEYARRSAIAQQKLAREEEPQLGVLKIQNQNMNRPIYFLPLPKTPRSDTSVNIAR